MQSDVIGLTPANCDNRLYSTPMTCPASFSRAEAIAMGTTTTNGFKVSASIKTTVEVPFIGKSDVTIGTEYSYLWS